MERRKLKKPLSIRSVLEHTLREMGWGNSLHHHQVLGLWKEIVGPMISAHAQPIGLRGGLLIVAVEDSMWLHQLHLFKHRILADLQRRLPQVHLRDIVLRIGTLRKLPGDTLDSGAPAFVECNLGPEERDKIEEILSPLPEEGCREVVKRILFRCLGRKESSRGRYS